MPSSSMACIMPSSLSVPVTKRARRSSSSGTRLRLPPCASVTITSVAPPSNAPSIAALTSRVMRRRARSYSALDVGRAERPSAGVTWTQLETPAVPSMSAEIRIFMGASHDAGGPTGRAEPAVEIEPVLWHEAYRAPADQLDAGDLGG